MDALKQVSAVIHTLCAEKGLQYQVSVSAGCSRALCGDEMQLKQVLLSVLDNAVKYTEAPGTVGFVRRMCF